MMFLRMTPTEIEHSDYRSLSPLLHQDGAPMLFGLVFGEGVVSVRLVGGWLLQLCRAIPLHAFLSSDPGKQH